jgi:hypothetical protein
MHLRQLKSSFDAVWLFPSIAVVTCRISSDQRNLETGTLVG